MIATLFLLLLAGLVLELAILTWHVVRCQSQLVRHAASANWLRQIRAGDRVRYEDQLLGEARAVTRLLSEVRDHVIPDDATPEHKNDLYYQGSFKGGIW